MRVKKTDGSNKKLYVTCWLVWRTCRIGVNAANPIFRRRRCECHLHHVLVLRRAVCHSIRVVHKHGHGNTFQKVSRLFRPWYRARSRWGITSVLILYNLLFPSLHLSSGPVFCLDRFWRGIKTHPFHSFRTKKPAPNSNRWTAAVCLWNHPSTCPLYSMMKENAIVDPALIGSDEGRTGRWTDGQTGNRRRTDRLSFFLLCLQQQRSRLKWL